MFAPTEAVPAGTVPAALPATLVQPRLQNRHTVQPNNVTQRTQVFPVPRVFPCAHRCTLHILSQRFLTVFVTGSACGTLLYSAFHFCQVYRLSSLCQR